MTGFLDIIGSYALNKCNQLGSFAIFFAKTLKCLFTKKLKTKLTLIQANHIGVESFSIVFLTGISSGFALALQSYVGLSRFGGEGLIGVVVAMAMARELAPVFTAIMVTGRAGSAMTAEIGTMEITEQIDALKTLCIDPYQYLIVPRIIASTIMMPFLTSISMLCGVAGGYIFNLKVLGLNPEAYIQTIRSYVEISDIVGGLIKSAFFGFILSTTSTYIGYNTTGGAKGIGIATTQSVVVGCILILISNYFLSSLLFKAGI